MKAMIIIPIGPCWITGDPLSVPGLGDPGFGPLINPSYRHSPG